MPVLFVNGHQIQVEKGTTFEEVVNRVWTPDPRRKGRPALVYFNGKMRELFKRIDKDGIVKIITTDESAGHNTYVRTATMMLVVAARNVLTRDYPVNDEGIEYVDDPSEIPMNSKLLNRKDVRIKVEFTLGDAYYCSVIGDIVPGVENTPEILREFATKLYDEMLGLHKRNIQITKKTYPIDDAISLFRHEGMVDKEQLFHFRRSSTINVYCLDGFYDYYYGHMMPSTSYIDQFDVTAYEEGLLLHLPNMDTPDMLSPFHEERNIYEQLMLSKEWGELVDISTIGDLNMQVCKGHISELVLVQEALQERRIGDIAEQIYESPDVKFVLVAGPSSSGKTTFAHRLSIQLRSFGLRPHIISMDNWFVNRERTPIDEDGNYNFDVLEAIDLELFNEDMSALLSGEEIDLPTFDFKAGRRKYHGDKLRLEENDILVIEGIHGLNPKSTVELPNENKFKIYISALTSLNIDEHNRIATSDTRLLRRIIRDARTRGNNAASTIAGWSKVRDGEEQFIFPFQENVDATFNSVLIYEQAVLKQYAEPLLYRVDKQNPSYYEAKRLLKFLDYFVGVDTSAVPTNSICREFVGGGCFGQ